MSFMKIMDPSASANFIANQAQHVKIAMNGIQHITKMVKEAITSNEYTIQTWKSHPLHPKNMDLNAINWIFVVDTLNFSFWTEPSTEKFSVMYKGEEYTGYWSLCAAINRALDEGIPMTDAGYLSKITLEELQKVFRSENDTVMPLMEERLLVLQEAGNTVLKKFDGSFVNCILACDKSAKRFVDVIVKNFPSYRDSATYKNQTVTFYKRAQILVADIWACFEGEGLGYFHDIDTITMFADYRIPQALAFFGALEYSSELQNVLEKDVLMCNGDEMEVELRGMSIRAVEYITEAVKKDLPQHAFVNGIVVDHYLWDYRRAHAKEIQATPFHKVRSIFY